MVRSLPSLALVRDALLVAALAVLTVQALRRWAGDRYLVPSGSMEPVLHGHPRDGDVVFVDKLADPGALRRGDLVVVHHPREAGQRMVKRIAARGDDDDACCLDIRQGDLWLGPDPQRLRLEQKDPLAARGQRVTWASVPGSAASRNGIDLAAAGGDGAPAGPWQLAGLPLSLAEARTQLRPAARAARRQRGERLLPDGFLGAARPIDAGFVDATGARGATGADVAVTDVGMELAFDLASPSPGAAGEVLASVETRHEVLTFHWQPATGRVVLWRDGEDVAARTLPVVERPATLEFGLLDDRAFLVVDGRPDAMVVVPRDPAWQAPARNGAPPGPRSLVWVGVVGGAGGGLRFASVRVFHDVFAWRDPIVGMPGEAGGWPRFVPPGHWFLLGDSAFDSRDSRQFGPVPQADFVGVPRCVLGPWPRRRWVRP